MSSTTMDPPGQPQHKPQYAEEAIMSGSLQRERGRLGRLASTGLAVAYMLLAIPALALFVIVSTAIPLVIITVGALMLLVFVPVVAALAQAHRHIASRVLLEPVRPFYKPTKGLGVLGRLQRWAGDPARWRDYVWLFVSSTVGFTLGLIGTVLFLSIFWYLIYPFLFAVTPEGVFEEDLGFMVIDTQQETFLMWIGALVFFLLWWICIKPLVRLQAVIDRALLSSRTQRLEQRVEHLSTSRAATVDQSAAEIRRIERDLHDGAQARLVSLGMSLGMADELLAHDPEAARKMLSEARLTTSAALGDLRSVVRGIHPPVLADRGLGGAVQALAMDMAIPVTVTVMLAKRPPAPVESAAYFAVAESLANIGKHANASRAWISVEQRNSDLHIEVGDDGRGGANPESGTGLRGVVRRLSAFDGTLALSSPDGGPTLVTVDIPRAFS
ncbi:MAG TPA: sensor domain-containing protein [Nocardioidaceae bacterium]|jgi:signal transduction histidine kinase